MDGAITADIILTTFNARYSHSSFGLRYLLANMGDLRTRTTMMEFDIHHTPAAAAAQILEQRPRIVGIGTYIWNVRLVEELIRSLKSENPELVVVIGGPEVSYTPDELPVTADADFTICGEADLAFAELCRGLLDGRTPPSRIIRATPPNPGALNLPYGAYTDEDVRHRFVYVETTRGCPFRCEYCISSLDPRLRRFPLKTLFPVFTRLMDRGVRYFKFVDRTFNVEIDRCLEVLGFFLERAPADMGLHFEMIPDRFPEELKEMIRRFPPGSLHFEIGIQTYSEDVAERIMRKTDFAKADANLRFLRQETGVLIHADLIAGLPGESVDSFAEGFDRLVALQPHELQFGILKKLHGAPIARHDDEWGMVYNTDPPYDVTETKLIDASSMEGLKRAARVWDLLYNRGNFTGTAALLWADGRSVFKSLRAFTEWTYAQTRRTHAIKLEELAQYVFRYLTEELGMPPPDVAERIWQDYHADGRRRYVPQFLRPFIGPLRR